MEHFKRVSSNSYCAILALRMSRVRIFSSVCSSIRLRDVLTVHRSIALPLVRYGLRCQTKPAPSMTTPERPSLGVKIRSIMKYSTAAHSMVLFCIQSLYSDIGVSRLYVPPRSFSLYRIRSDCIKRYSLEVLLV